MTCPSPPCDPQGTTVSYAKLLLCFGTGADSQEARNIAVETVPLTITLPYPAWTRYKAAELGKP
jgi:hypothetical protein